MGTGGVKGCPTSITIEQKDKETCKNHGKWAFGDFGGGGAGWAIAPLDFARYRGKTLFFKRS